jgi:alpha-tubulin suppressor-like RCC1 family protein
MAANRVLRIASILMVPILVCSRSPVLRAESIGIYSFGFNQYGQAGVNSTKNALIASPLANSNLADSKMVAMSGGDQHSLLIDNEGTVFSIGSNYFGQSGLHTANGNTLRATPIDMSGLMGKRITDVSAGSFHSLLLANDGTVFSFGYNESGRTGVGTFIGNTLSATPIDVSNLDGKSITQISGGISHSLILADDGTVFSFGWNRHGRTGQGVSIGYTLLATPIDATNLAGKSITQISAGGYHNLLLASDGTVFSFGRNLNGPTGGRYTEVATQIDESNLVGKNIIQIAAGNDHSLLLADDGTVFSFGSNRNGQTGLGTTNLSTSIATPIDSTNLAGKSIVQIAAAYNSSLLLADDGTAFSFGSNQYGQTGLGKETGNTLIATPIDVSNLMGGTVTQIAAGGYHYFLATVPEPSGAIQSLIMGWLLISVRRLGRLSS